MSKNKKTKNRRKNRNLPRFLQSALWSYDINKIDVKKDRNLIIQQVLNYGNWETICWLFNNYPEKDIVNIIKNPLRGRWFEQVLDYWSLIFNLKISRNKYNKAIFDINPKF